MSRSLHEIRPEGYIRREVVFEPEVRTRPGVGPFLDAHGIKVHAGERGTVKTVFM